MNKTLSTQDKLLQAARELFWTRGYSHVSVRDITKAAGVDVALVSRYFDGKQGLFEATLAELPPWEALEADSEEFLAAAVASFSQPADPATEQANPFAMLLINSIDPQMGHVIRDLLQNALADPVTEKLGGPHAAERSAMLLAVLFGMTLMRKNFQLDALTDKSPEQIGSQIAHLADAALRYED